MLHQCWLDNQTISVPASQRSSEIIGYLTNFLMVCSASTHMYPYTMDTTWWLNTFIWYVCTLLLEKVLNKRNHPKFIMQESWDLRYFQILSRWQVEWIKKGSKKFSQILKIHLIRLSWPQIHVKHCRPHAKDKSDVMHRRVMDIYKEWNDALRKVRADKFWHI